MQTWQLIIDPPSDGKTNMDKDQALALEAEKTSSPTLRLYRWKAPTLSLGYTQNDRSAINLNFCQTSGIEVVKRPTGGKAVLHHQELTYSFTAQNDHPLFPQSLSGRYKVINQALIQSLVFLGIKGVVYSSRKESGVPHPEDCFLNRALHELTFEGKKIIGSAQRKYARTFLQHGSILLDWDRELHTSIFSTPAKDQEKNFTGLNMIGNKIFSYEDIIKAIIEGFRKEFAIEF